MFAQYDLIGQVLDAATKEPLPYVNIGLINKNIGTVSDDYGYFELGVNAQLNAQDTLLFSMIGFESKSFEWVVPESIPMTQREPKSP